VASTSTAFIITAVIILREVIRQAGP